MDGGKLFRIPSLWVEHITGGLLLAADPACASRCLAKKETRIIVFVQLVRSGLIVRNFASAKIKEFKYNRRPDVIAWRAATERIAAEREQLLREYTECNPTRALIARRLLIIHAVSTVRFLLIVAVLCFCFDFKLSTVIYVLAAFLLLGQLSKSVIWWLVVEPVHLPDFPPPPRE